MSKDRDSDDTPDPFDPSQLRLDPSYAKAIGVKKLLTTVPVKKPNRHEFVRVHPSSEYRLTAATIELKEDRETYVLTPEIAHQLADEFTPAILYTAISRQGVLFLWSVKLPGPDGKENAWHRSANEAAEMAMSAWVRVAANMSLGAYDIHVAQGDMPEPEWPDFSFSEILRIAFRERHVNSMDHPLLKRLRGEA